ncbi:hypothetical protein NPX13_g961 [Xylaria arbuscula]|uniref:Methyltransferase domain-containing protein n=1 Tax=Xylaria arbuscula TaxID=114810 RepID=A0A9W8NNK7_9PEZI|nr:hypothetical protein NPX13_g961 [Xylaria arbuscula]
MAPTPTGTSYSEPEYAKAQDRAKVPFYTPDITSRLVPETQDLLEKYSNVPRDQQVKHVHLIVSSLPATMIESPMSLGEVKLDTIRIASNENLTLAAQRDKAWDIRAYPCIGLGVWLTPQLRRLPTYQNIVSRLKDGESLMDVGTFIGHDLRRLVYDGAPSENLFGVDIVNHFDVGYEFFRDRDTFRGVFIEADFLSSSPQLVALRGKIDILLVSQLLHQWDWEHQVKALETLIGFTRPGSAIVGNQIGNSIAQSVTFKTDPPATTWRHDCESLDKMFAEAGKATGSKWETQAWLRSSEEMGWDEKALAWMEPNVCVIEFVANRVS